MVQSTEAVYSNGVLKPTRELGLRDQQRVRLIVEAIDETPENRDAALDRLRAGIARMQFFSKGPLPTREELHDRGSPEALSPPRPTTSRSASPNTPRRAP
ncbi:MAG: antitoxin family protein [Acidobacteria bacterium]|nr:antitoxin family protein [Acidobacteriota bacterium]